LRGALLIITPAHEEKIWRFYNIFRIEKVFTVAKYYPIKCEGTEIKSGDMKNGLIDWKADCRALLNAL